MSNKSTEHLNWADIITGHRAKRGKQIKASLVITSPQEWPWLNGLPMPDITLTTGKARKKSSNNFHHIFHGDEARVNEKMLVKHFKLLCRGTVYKYRAVLLVILMGWEFLLLEKDTPFELCWSCITVYPWLYNTAKVFETSNFLLSLNIGDVAVSSRNSALRVPKGEFDIEWLLKSMAVGVCVERCIIYYCTYKRKPQ